MKKENVIFVNARVHNKKLFEFRTNESGMEFSTRFLRLGVILSVYVAI